MTSLYTMPKKLYMKNKIEMVYKQRHFIMAILLLIFLSLLVFCVSYSNSVWPHISSGRIFIHKRNTVRPFKQPNFNYLSSPTAVSFATLVWRLYLEVIPRTCNNIHFGYKRFTGWGNIIPYHLCNIELQLFT